MISLKILLDDAKRSLSSCGITTASIDADVLMCHLLGCDRSYLYVNHDMGVDASTTLMFLDMVRLRMSFMPVAYITGKKEFMGIDFIVSKHTLIPRGDSEVLIEAVLKHFTDMSCCYNILDLGAGSGCLGISLLLSYKEARALFVDISYDALDIAKNNAILHGVSKRCKFFQNNWLKGLTKEFLYDIIVCNPPYIDEKQTLMPDVALHEPHSALFAKNKGYAEYEIIAQQLSGYMHKDTIAFFEIGQGQLQSVELIMNKNNLRIFDVHLDIQKIERVVTIKKSAF